MNTEQTDTELTTPVQSKKTLHEILLSPEVAQSLDEVARGLITGQRLAAIIWQCCQKTPTLMRCSPASLISACKTLVQAGCEPDGIHGYLVPFDKYNKDKKYEATICTPIPTARGLMRMARSNGVKNLHIGIVREGDEFLWEILDGVFHVSHKANGWNDDNPAIGYYCSWYDKDGMPHGERMSKSAVDKIKGRSKAKSNGPWVTDYDQMALKTIIKRASKQWDLPYEIQQAMNDADVVEFEGIRNVTPPKKAHVNSQSIDPTRRPGEIEDSHESDDAPESQLEDLENLPDLPF